MINRQYYFQCGNVATHYVHIEHGSGCPKCSALLVEITAECPDCGKRITVTKQQGNLSRCRECNLALYGPGYFRKHKKREKKIPQVLAQAPTVKLNYFDHGSTIFICSLLASSEVIRGHGTRHVASPYGY